MSVLPSKKRELYSNLGLPSDVVETIISQSDLDTYFTNLVSLDLSEELLKLSANYLTSDVVSVRNNSEKTLTELDINHFVELMTLLSESKIGSRVAKDLLPELFGSKQSPLQLAQERGLLQVSDGDALQVVIDEIVSENETVVAEYRAGKDAALQFLVGQGMKKTKGTANPAVFREMLIKTIDK
jgi:aspartyl-tRNA(Asn)/glutamyl-tRNA(Gln) amidotransferase subunit B